METATPTTTRLARSAIREKIRHFAQLDRDLTAQLIANYRTRKSGAPIPIIDESAKLAQARAKELLSEHSHILPTTLVPSPNDDQSLTTEQLAVRMILAALQREDTEAEVAERIAWTEAHAEDWPEIVRDWCVAAAAFEAAEDRAYEFIIRAEGNTPTPLSNIVGRGNEIWLRADRLENVLRAAVDQGVISDVDLIMAKNSKGAKNAKR